MTSTKSLIDLSVEDIAEFYNLHRKMKNAKENCRATELFNLLVFCITKLNDDVIGGLTDAILKSETDLDETQRLNVILSVKTSHPLKADGVEATKLPKEAKARDGAMSVSA